MDLYVFLMKKRKLTQSAINAGGDDTHPLCYHPGDVVTVRRANHPSALGTDAERSHLDANLFVMGISDVPNDKAEKVVSILLNEPRDIDEIRLRRRGYTLAGQFYLGTKEQIAAWIQSNYPTEWPDFRDYFPANVTQPTDGIPVIPYAALKSKVWNKTTAEYASEAELED